MLRRLLALFLCAALLLPAIPSFAEMPVSSAVSLPSTAEDFLNRAMDYFTAGDSEKALISLDLAAKLDPDNEEPYLAMAVVHRENGDTEAVLRCVENALSLNPALGIGWLLLMDCHMAQDKPEDAELDALYAEVCGCIPDSARWAQLGALWLSAGYAENAKIAFEKAQLDTLTEDQRAAYRKALIRTGNMEKAEALGLIQVGSRDPLLDDAYETGALSLREVKLFSEDRTGYTFIVPEEIAEGEEEGLISRENGYCVFAVPAEDLEGFESYSHLLALSPDGLTSLWADGEYVYALRGKVFTLLHVSSNRGVEDIYEKLPRYTKQLARNFPGREGAVWSPDSRYVVFTSYRQALSGGQSIDPVIIDTHTGEIFLAATYPKVFSEGHGTIAYARFDSSGKYLYYMLYGNYYGEHTSLVRYNLQTGENELCHNNHSGVYMAGLYELGDGRWMHATDNPDHGLPRTLSLYTPRDGVWKHSEIPFTPPENWEEASNSSQFPLYNHGLYYSANSGYALTLFAGANQTDFILSKVRPDADFEDMNIYWTLQNLDDAQLSLLTYESYKATAADVVASSDMQPPYNPLLRSASLNCIQLSPDGHYALLTAIKDGKCAFLMLRLEDMTLKPVAVPEELLHIKYANALGLTYAPGVTWNEGGSLLILKEDGAVGVYEFQ